MTAVSSFAVAALRYAGVSPDVITEQGNGSVVVTFGEQGRVELTLASRADRFWRYTVRTADGGLEYSEGARSVNVAAREIAEIIAV